MEYTKEYFIEKFEKVPDKRWGEGLRDNCALAQCGVTIEGLVYNNTPESIALIRLFGGMGEGDEADVYEINDGTARDLPPGSSPKERILNHLKSINV